MKSLDRFVAVAALMFVAAFPMSLSAAEKPNIVLVFLDNFGWGEPGFNGGGIIRGAATPKLDQIVCVFASEILTGLSEPEPDEGLQQEFCGLAV